MRSTVAVSGTVPEPERRTKGWEAPQLVEARLCLWEKGGQRKGRVWNRKRGGSHVPAARNGGEAHVGHVQGEGIHLRVGGPWERMRSERAAAGGGRARSDALPGLTVGTRAWA